MPRVLGLIPARYASGRMPGKPLADIAGKPMVWWVHRAMAAVAELVDICVATDDARVANACRALGLCAVMTSPACPTHLDRLAEAAQQLHADFYLCVNGDEPLIEPACIRDLLPPPDAGPAYAACGMTALRNPAHLADTSKGKVVCDAFGNGLYISRVPLPYPQGRMDYPFKKFVGVQCFGREALDFVARTPRGLLESTEDCDEFRFLENGYKLRFVETESVSFSVDMEKDLLRARSILETTAP